MQVRAQERGLVVKGPPKPPDVYDFRLPVTIYKFVAIIVVFQKFHPSLPDVASKANILLSKEFDYKAHPVSAW